MNPGDLILVPFPFADLDVQKVRPSVVIHRTEKYNDIILCAISSVVPKALGDYEILIKPNPNNGLRVESIIRVERIATLREERAIEKIGSLSDTQLNLLLKTLRDLFK
ncbi:type II toxin-antitoxin system PemK/MazF family toxin [Ekhidna sp.]|uniref:type II toxin-antitoxin system PemK/MazF family toxin n=1 Tax=Ekhidna sp. TaxID=2608089 RepID=UPI003CCBBB7F